MKLLTTHCSHFSYFFRSLRPKYLSQQSILEHSQPGLFPRMRDQTSCPYKTRSKAVVLGSFIFIFLNGQREDSLDRIAADIRRI
jgi:hypothetical protein